MMNLTSQIAHPTSAAQYSFRASGFEIGAPPAGWGVRRTNVEFECEALLSEPLKAEGFLKLSNIKLLCPKANG